MRRGRCSGDETGDERDKGAAVPARTFGITRTLTNLLCTVCLFSAYAIVSSSYCTTLSDDPQLRSHSDTENGVVRSSMKKRVLSLLGGRQY